MDLKKIQTILNTSHSDSLKRSVILDIIAEDENALVDMMKILATERERKRELISEMNMQLSRADVFIKCPKIAESDFITGEIEKFYQQHSSMVTHCYQNKAKDKCETASKKEI